MVDDDEETWLAPPSRRRAPPVIEGPLPKSVTIVRADQIYVPRDNLAAPLVARLLRIAAFQNPEFYSAQAMRRPTFAFPRIIACGELTSHHVGLPRGCFDAVLALFDSVHIGVDVEDRRFEGPRISVSCVGQLRAEQEAAVSALLRSDCGVLAATTAFGKTVVGIKMIAERGLRTLILVHRRILLDQWIERLVCFSDIPREAIGVIGGGRRKPRGIVDIALIQSLVRKGEVDDLVADYGQVIVDECHHLSAVSFELVARRSKARFVLGLSATVTRKDGHHPIIAMQCGPIRHRVDARSEAKARPFKHSVVIRNADFVLPVSTPEPPPIQDIFRAVATDVTRNELIFNDILYALEAKRSSVVITERTDHLEHFASRLKAFAKNVIVLRGGQSDRQRRELAARLSSIPDSEERLILSTGRYLGEGFDDPRLDTLFLTMPIAWKGTVAQYAGRLHRLHEGKHEVRICDYVDADVPVLARMAAKRRRAYQSIGYTISASTDDSAYQRPPNDVVCALAPGTEQLVGRVQPHLAQCTEE
jgi:superfamily II DNA or RNA helicase